MTEKQKEITFQHFLTWLEGVEDMQPDGWVPNEQQWKRIRSKLNTVVEQESTSTSIQIPQPYYNQLPPGPTPYYGGNPSNSGLLNPTLVIDDTLPSNINNPGAPTGTETGLINGPGQSGFA